jgi:hypothetical protein
MKMSRKTPKLNQVLAIEKGVKSRATGTITSLYHKVQKNVLVNGLMKTYKPLDEEGQVYPPERQRVQVKADDVLRDTRKALTELFNVTAQKDWANCSARADVVVNGTVLLADAPVTYLLFLEKQLTDLKTLVSKIPVLDASEDWTYDEAKGVFKAEESRTTRTQKVQKPIVLYPATEEHPAQTQLVSEDVIVGHWTTVKQSGALPADKKAKTTERLGKVIEAVKFARETANSQDAERLDVAETLFSYILG